MYRYASYVLLVSKPAFYFFNFPCVKISAIVYDWLSVDWNVQYECVRLGMFIKSRDLLLSRVRNVIPGICWCHESVLSFCFVIGFKEQYGVPYREGNVIHY